MCQASVMMSTRLRLAVGLLVVSMGTAAAGQATGSATWKRLRLDVRLGGTGAGAVVSVPPGIHCHPKCIATFAKGRVVRLRAIANDGSRFKGWQGICRGQGSECRLTLATPRIVTVLFVSLDRPSGGPPQGLVAP